MITLTRRQGQPIQHGEVTATPQLWVLTFTPPWGGGAVYSRPASVLVRQGDAERRIPILDATLVALAVIGLITTLILIGGKRHAAG
jgi:hypothetical protein